jgi:hypothetical protein
VFVTDRSFFSTWRFPVTKGFGAGLSLGEVGSHTEIDPPRRGTRQGKKRQNDANSSNEITRSSSETQPVHRNLDSICRLFCDAAGSFVRERAQVGPERQITL